MFSTNPSKDGGGGDQEPSCADVEVSTKSATVESNLVVVSKNRWARSLLPSQPTYSWVYVLRAVVLTLSHASEFPGWAC